MRKRFQVFVSSTFRDLVPERAAVMGALQEAGYLPIGMEYFPADNAESLKVIEQLIDTTDFYVLVVAGKYGSLSSDGRSFTEREYDYSTSVGVPVLAFVNSNTDNMLSKNVETDPEQFEKLKKFIAKVEERHNRKGWATKEELALKVIASLAFAVNTYARPGWIRGSDQADVESLKTQLNQALQSNKSLTEERNALQTRLGQLDHAADLAKPGELVRLTLLAKNDFSEYSAFAEERHPPPAEFEVAVEWGAIYRCLGRPLFDMAHEGEIRDRISDLAEHICDQDLSEFKNVMIDIESLKKVRRVLIAKNLIVGNGDWLLTDAGKKFFIPWAL